MSIRSDAAFHEIYTTHRDRVYGLARRLTRSADDAEDLTQDTFVRAWSALGDFRHQSSLATWLHRIAVRLFLKRQATHERRLRLLPVAPNDGSWNSSSNELRLDLEAAIATLPAMSRTVIVLHDIYGYDHAEVAEMLNVRPGTSRWHLHHARQQLMKELEQ